MSLDGFENEDLYGVLGVTIESTSAEIVKAFRTQARIHHPDKNKNDPGAHERFLRLSRAFEILSDETAKAAYDKVIRAKLAALARRRQLDVKRQKLRDELEARERAALSEVIDEQAAEKQLKREIDRLRREGSALLRQEQERMRAENLQQQEEDSNSNDVLEVHPRLKLKWKKTESVTEADLRVLLEEISPVNLIVMSKKGGSALVEFENMHNAVTVADKIGLRSSFAISVSWLTDPPRKSPDVNSRDGTTEKDAMPEKAKPNAPKPPQATLASSTDFETLVLTRMRQAEERKRITAEMKSEELGES